ncbi:MAG: hypothetical protein M1831_005199 [Alyxoria varia]|nr:MAG: hypothetical protein M1831_005199 [Alyxoria varia]
MKGRTRKLKSKGNAAAPPTRSSNSSSSNQPPSAYQDENDKDVESDDVSGDLSVNRSGAGIPEQTTSSRHSADSTLARRRYRPPREKTPHEVPAYEGSLVSDILNDIWTLIKSFAYLPRKLYPIAKWILLAYLMWLAISYPTVIIYRSIKTTIAPLCDIPIIGPRIPLCSLPFELQDRPVDGSKMAKSQDELVVVGDQAGQNFDLARDMVGSEFAVRDLHIRVMASNLSRKKELARELESLIRYTKQTAKGLSRFTAKVGKLMDTVSTFDEYAAKALETIDERQHKVPSLSARIVQVFKPLAAFDVGNTEDFKVQVKDVFISTATRISSKVKLLTDDSFSNAHDLDNVQETLDRIKEIALDEIGDLPRTNILGALWTRLAHADDYEEQQSHTSLLTDMTVFYERSSYVMKETTAALNRVEAELSEFRDGFATPGLILKDYPLELTIALLRKSGHRLDAVRGNLERVEEGRRPQVGSTKFGIPGT